jgi:hypothetical protein
MVKAPPSTPFKMPEPDLLLEFLIIPLDAPAQFGSVDEVAERDVFRKGGEPAFVGSSSPSGHSTNSHSFIGFFRRS